MRFCQHDAGPASHTEPLRPLAPIHCPFKVPQARFLTRIWKLAFPDSLRHSEPSSGKPAPCAPAFGDLQSYCTGRASCLARCGGGWRESSLSAQKATGQRAGDAGLSGTSEGAGRAVLLAANAAVTVSPAVLHEGA
jgi:hypothetical protein